jgi:hypothetical protein
MTDEGPPWARTGVIAGFLGLLGAAFVSIAVNSTTDPTVWWLLAVSGFVLAGLLIVGTLVSSILRSRKAKRERRFPPGQEPLMKTPPEHQVLPPGPVIDSTWAEQAAKREEAIYGERSPNWNFFHLAWPLELGGPAVWLEAHGPDEDPRSNVWCVVRRPDGTTTERDTSSAFTTPGPDPDKIDVQWRYPQDFPNGSDATYLQDGKYEVEWYGQRQVGRDLLGTDCFLIEGGQVKDCDGTPAETIPDFD